MRLVASALSLFSVSVAAQVTLEVCLSSPKQTFDVRGDGVIVASDGTCLSFDASSSTLVSTVCASTPDSWTWHADGTVESKLFPGQCWNANSGQSAPGTTIIKYACGSAPTLVAANDEFYFNVAESHIVGNESGLCFSLPAPPPPPGSCSSNLDCSLNGECSGNKCVCYAPWTGALDCSSLSFAPTPVSRGFPTPGFNETTWGGSIALGDDGKYHMFVAEMMNECPLSTWGQNSRCRHAVSSTPEGPYVGMDVSVTNWCHNPAIVVKDGTWALFHIGDGTGGAVKNCSSGGGDASSSAPAASGGSTLHTAPSPNGPWTPATPLPRCNNPAPFLARNGSIFIVCEGSVLYRADDFGANGTENWIHVTNINPSGPRLNGNYEDPFLFQDPRGNFHVIYHVYRTGPIGGDAHNCLPGHDGAVVSGHAWSPDGLSWTTSATEPYGNVINLTDGSQQLVTTRERPKLLFNAAGDPTHLSNGVCPSPGNFNTPFSCPTVSTGCVDCKYNDWDFTNVSPLAF